MDLYEKNGKILYILNILKKYTDEEHMLSASEMQRKINMNSLLLLDYVILMDTIMYFYYIKICKLLLNIKHHNGKML